MNEDLFSCNISSQEIESPTRVITHIFKRNGEVYTWKANAKKEKGKSTKQQKLRRRRRRNRAMTNFRNVDENWIFLLQQ